jgi:hypothetical protein
MGRVGVLAESTETIPTLLLTKQALKTFAGLYDPEDEWATDWAILVTVWDFPPQAGLIGKRYVATTIRCGSTSAQGAVEWGCTCASIPYSSARLGEGA